MTKTCKTTPKPYGQNCVPPPTPFANPSCLSTYEHQKSRFWLGPKDSTHQSKRCAWKTGSAIKQLRPLPSAPHTLPVPRLDALQHKSVCEEKKHPNNNYWPPPWARSSGVRPFEAWRMQVLAVPVSSKAASRGHWVKWGCTCLQKLFQQQSWKDLQHCMENNSVIWLILDSRVLFSASYCAFSAVLICKIGAE